MLPLRSRLVAAVSALALGLPLGAGALAVAPAVAVSVPRLGLATAIERASAPVTSGVSSWDEARRAAEAALDRAQRRLAGDRTSLGRHVAQDRSDFTLTLRDLRVGLDYLSPDDRVAARRVLARPTQGANDPNGDGYEKSATKHHACTAHLCVWWVTHPGDSTDPDPVPDVDSNGNGRPDQVDLTLSVMDHVWDTIVTKGGYRAPRPDGGLGGNDKLDIFLADIGDEGLFGYCAPELASSGRSASGYCVLDNDYSSAQFGTSQKPADNLKVTAAHEFFHAVQFAYDVGEDDWFMEGTAMWMEDEVYDDVNDNVRYLQGSQLTTPTRALDQPASGLGGPYVSWIFWRYVSEQYPDTGTTGLPLIVRDVWRRAQAYTSNYPRTYSMRALAEAVAARGNSLANVFARFGEANRHPGDAYSEGAEQHYPQVPAVASYTLSKSHTGTGEKVATMAHMTNYTVVLTPGSDLAGADWVVRIPVNAPAYSRGARAQVSVVLSDGTRVRRWVALDKDGNGVASARFRYGKVRRVELTMTNAGQRYDCNQGTYLACQGTSRDNGLKTYFKATIKRS